MFAYAIGLGSIVWWLGAGGAPSFPGHLRDAASMARAARIGPCVTGYDVELVPTLELLWQRSPTYRRQCAALAERRAIISLRLEPREIGGGTRAESVLGSLENGRIVVRSRLRTNGPLPELVSHELEHALEFAEGVNYRVEVLRGTALLGPGNRIETRRADRAGRQAASEVKSWKAAKAAPPLAGLQTAPANP